MTKKKQSSSGKSSGGKKKTTSTRSQRSSASGTKTTASSRRAKPGVSRRKKASSSKNSKKPVASKIKKSGASNTKRTTKKKTSKRNKPKKSPITFILIAAPLLALSFFAGFYVSNTDPYGDTKPSRVASEKNQHRQELEPEKRARNSEPTGGEDIKRTDYYREGPASPVSDSVPVKAKAPSYSEKEYAYLPSPTVRSKTKKPEIPDKHESSTKPAPPPPSAGKKKVCLVLDDFGYNFTNEMRQVLDLHPNITPAILPSQPKSREVMDYAVRTGHEVIVHAPFEGVDGCTEPRYIRSGESSERIQRLLFMWFQELPAAVGINNHQGSVATANKETMTYVMDFLQSRDKLFIDSLTSGSSQGYRIARMAGVPYAKRTAPFLDNRDDSVKIRKYIDHWLALAVSRHKKIPIAIGHITKRHTRRVLLEIIPKLPEMGYKLVPVSEVVKSTPKKKE